MDISNLKPSQRVNIFCTQIEIQITCVRIICTWINKWWTLRIFRTMRTSNLKPSQSMKIFSTQIEVQITCVRITWFVPKVSLLIFLCTNWQRSTSLMYIGMLVVTLSAYLYLFQLDWLSQSCATAVCVWSCFLTSLHLRCRKISNKCTLSNFV